MELFKIISRYVYPSIRRRLVEILYNDYKLTQEEIARLMHITQSAVSRYVKGNRGSYLDIRMAPKTDAEVKKLAKMLIDKRKIDKKELEYELNLITFMAMGSGEICQFHSEIDGSVDPLTCKLCMKLFRGEEAPQ